MTSRTYSRKSTSAQQRITAKTGATEIGVASVHKATMVKIDWTESQTVKITARKAFDLQVELVEVKKDIYTPFRTTTMHVAAGKVLHFVKSGRPGYYYLVTTTSTGAVRCSCPAHEGCKHLRTLDIVSFEQLKLSRWAELSRGNLEGAKKVEDEIEAQRARFLPRAGKEAA